MACPICETTNYTRLDYRARVPILQNRVWPTVEAAKAAHARSLSLRQIGAELASASPPLLNQSGKPYAAQSVKRMLSRVER